MPPLKFTEADAERCADDWGANCGSGALAAIMGISSAIIISFRGHPDAEAITLALRQSYSLGHEFGIERAAKVVDRCNRDGPYNAIGAAREIRALRIVEPAALTPTIEESLMVAESGETA